MKILIIEEKGHHDINRNYSYGASWQRIFTKLNHDCVLWGLGHNNYSDYINYNDYDVIITSADYNNNWLPNLKNIDNPIKFFICIDPHIRGVEPYMSILHNHGYNLLLQSTHSFLNEQSFFFPNAIPDDLIKPLPILKKYDIGFCGSIGNRGEYIEYLAQNFNLKKDIWVLGDDMVKAINSYYIHFNKNHSIDVNCSCIETIGCKTVLLTNNNSQYELMGFKHNINCLIYNDLNTLYQIIKENINNKNKLNQIAESGYQLSKKHTLTNRANKIIELYHYIKQNKNIIEINYQFNNN